MRSGHPVAYGVGWRLSRRGIVLISGGLLLLQAVVLGYLAAGSYGLVPRYGPDTISFVSFYAAGQLADRGHAPLVYDEPILDEGEEDLTHPGVRSIPFLYPPVYLLICAPLALLPAIPAFVIFEALTLALYLTVVGRIINASGWEWVLPTLAFPPVFWTIGYGQNAFLTAALFGAGTLLTERRPFLAGMLFGLLCYKLQFALLVPVALLAGKRWASIAGAAASVGLLAVLSVILFGPDTWHAWIGSAAASGAATNFAIDRVNIFASISPFAAARLLGFSNDHARLVQFAASAACVVIVAWAWRSPASHAIRSAVLIAGTLVAVPYALLYDLTLAAIAGAWLIRSKASGSWDLPALAMIYLLPLVAFQAGLFFRLPLAPIVGCGLMALTVMRAWQERSPYREVA